MYPTHRTTLRLTTVTTAFGALLLCGGAARLASAQPPNIVFIAVDDLNDWVSCLAGHPQAQTPHIDQLARRGTLFANAHCQSPLCNSSRTSLMTGLRPSTTGIYGLEPWFRTVPELADVVTLPQYLKQHGYRTLTAGKIYHGAAGRRPTDNEFDVIGPASGVGITPPKKLVNTPSDNPLVDWGVFDHRDDQKQDYKVATWAVEQLHQAQPAPFFLSVGFFLPHVPCYATQQWFDLYPEPSLLLPPIRDDDRDDTPRFSWYLHWDLPEPRLRYLREADQHVNLVRSYLACISFVDSQIGRVLDALEQSAHYNNTVVVLWSDHGWHLGEKLITGKNTLWEPSTRVPLVFAGPGINGNATCARPAELLDIYPTLLELCQLPPNPANEGISLVPLLRDAHTARERPAITTHNQNNHAVRSEQWRYIVYADGSEELYDLTKDPEEWHNVAGDASNDTIAASHRAWLPQRNARPVAGSHSRVLIDNDDQWYWEGKPVTAADAIPGL